MLLELPSDTEHSQQLPSVLRDDTNNICLCSAILILPSTSHSWELYNNRRDSSKTPQEPLKTLSSFITSQ